MKRALTAITYLFSLAAVFTLSACPFEENFNDCTPPTSLRQPDADNPILAIAGKDTFVAGWTQAYTESANVRAYIVHYEFGWGWFYSDLVDDDGDGQVTLLRLAGSANGTEFAAWYKKSPRGNRVYASRFLNQINTWWEPPVPLTDSVTVLDFAIAADDDGNAIVVWTQADSPYSRLYARRYTTAAGWDAAQIIDDNTGNCTFPRLAMDAAGNAAAVWQHDAGGSTGIYANGFGSTAGWGAARRISNGSGNAFDPDLAMNSSGTAVAVWCQDDAGVSNAYAARFIQASGWETPMTIESGSADADKVHAAINDTGAVAAVWRQGDIYFNRYTPNAGWGTEQIIAQGLVDQPGIAVDPEGRAVAVWSQWDPAGPNPGDALVYARKFDPSAGWNTEIILTSEQGSAKGPHTAIDSKGNVTVIWSQSVASSASGTTSAVFTYSY